MQNKLYQDLKTHLEYFSHWDAFSGSIRQPILGPCRFLDWYAGATEAGFQAVERAMEKRPNLKVNLLPQWEVVKL